MGVVAPGRLAVGAGKDALVQGPVVRPGTSEPEAEGSNGKMNGKYRGKLSKWKRECKKQKLIQTVVDRLERKGRGIR